MKRLIRSKRNRKFLAPDGSWTKDTSAALAFSDIRAVVKARQEHRLENIELLLLMEDQPSQYDIVLPLGPAPRLNITVNRRCSDHAK